jgi:alpha-amylase
VASFDAVDSVDVHNTISWADIERDLSAWLGNPMQTDALAELYKLESRVKSTNAPDIIEDWRKLQTSDHFYYMCTKYFADGDVHKYFNPYDSPYDSYINFMNILDNLDYRCSKAADERQQQLTVTPARKKLSRCSQKENINSLCFSERR